MHPKKATLKELYNIIKSSLERRARVPGDDYGSYDGSALFEVSAHLRAPPFTVFISLAQLKQIVMPRTVPRLDGVGSSLVISYSRSNVMALHLATVVIVDSPELYFLRAACSSLRRHISLHKMKQA